MSHVVLLERRAERELRSLPRPVLKRVDALLRRLAEVPHPRGAVRLHGKEGGGWRVRVGEYRVLYIVDDDSHAVRVYRIAHRREAYR